ncbi:MAG: MATE family efflux transporter [Aristaeellaceae bacterium]
MMSKLHGWLEDAFTSEHFTYPQLRGMYGTLLLDSFFIILINMLSSAMVASTGEAAIAAVNMVGVVNGMVALVFNAFAVGGAIVIARAKGHGDGHGIRNAIGGTIALCGVTALTLSAGLYALSSLLVNALYPAAEPLLREYAIHYMRLMAISFIPYALFNAVFNAFRSLGDTKSSLLLTVVINTVHLVCSFVFINIMKLGVTGAGLSYITARVVGAGLALLWLLGIHNVFHVRIRHLFHFSRRITREIVSLGLPIASESALFQGGMLLVQVFLARLTTTELAAHGVANSILMLYMTTGNALTALTSTVCGQCFGAGAYPMVRRYCRKFIAAGRVILLGTCLLILPLLPLIISMYQPSERGTTLIYQCLLIASAGMPLIWCDGYVTPMALRAAGDVMFSTVVSVASLFIGRIAIGYVLTVVVGLGVPGVWLGMMVEWLIRAVLLRLRIRGDSWLAHHA